MDSAQIRVLEQMHQKSLGGLLEGLDGLALPPKVAAGAGREVEERGADLAHEARKRQLQQQQVRRLLVPPDLAQCDRSWPVPVRAAVGDRVAGCIAGCADGLVGRS